MKNFYGINKHDFLAYHGLNILVLSKLCVTLSIIFSSVSSLTHSQFSTQLNPSIKDAFYSFLGCCLISPTVAL